MIYQIHHTHSNSILQSFHFFSIDDTYWKPIFIWDLTKGIFQHYSQTYKRIIMKQIKVRYTDGRRYYVSYALRILMKLQTLYRPIYYVNRRRIYFLHLILYFHQINGKAASLDSIENTIDSLFANTRRDFNTINTTFRVN